MTSFFPDINVWLALSVASHQHNREAWSWIKRLRPADRLFLSRYTHLGLLRLLTNQTVMGEQTLTLGEAWAVYDRWIGDPRVEFHPEPRGLDTVFREATTPFAKKPASKSVGDCYLLAYADQCHASLVTFDQGLYKLARKRGCSAIVPNILPN